MPEPPGIYFREIDPTLDAELVLKWRTSEFVQQQMISRVATELDAQRRWLQSCRYRSDYYHWIICCAGLDVGLINIRGLDGAGESCSWGLYLGSSTLSGLGAFVPPYLYNWLFLDLRLSWVGAEVLASNQLAQRIHQFFGMTEVATDSNSPEVGTTKLTRVYRLTRDEWKCRTRYHHMVSAFPTNYWMNSPDFQRMRLGKGNPDS